MCCCNCVGMFRKNTVINMIILIYILNCTILIKILWWMTISIIMVFTYNVIYKWLQLMMLTYTLIVYCNWICIIVSVLFDTYFKVCYFLNVSNFKLSIFQFVEIVKLLKKCLLFVNHPESHSNISGSILIIYTAVKGNSFSETTICIFMFVNL